MTLAVLVSLLVTLGLFMMSCSGVQEPRCEGEYSVDGHHFYCCHVPTPEGSPVTLVCRQTRTEAFFAAKEMAPGSTVSMETYCCEATCDAPRLEFVCKKEIGSLEGDQIMDRVARVCRKHPTTAVRDLWAAKELCKEEG